MIHLRLVWRHYTLSEAELVRRRLSAVAHDLCANDPMGADALKEDPLTWLAELRDGRWLGAVNANHLGKSDSSPPGPTAIDRRDAPGDRLGPCSAAVPAS